MQGHILAGNFTMTGHSDLEQIETDDLNPYAIISFIERRMNMEIRASNQIEQVRSLGIQFAENDANIKGHDGSTSILLPGDKTLWMFGDTIEVPVEELPHSSIEGTCSNTAAIVPLQDISHGVRQYSYFKTEDGQHPRQLIPLFPAEHPVRKRLWAIHGVYHEGKIYLYYHEITLDMARNVYDTFKVDGMGVARGDVNTFQFERLPAADGSYRFWKGEQPGFGVFTEKLNGYLYLWGSQKSGMHLARVRIDDLEDSRAYEYLVEAPSPAEPGCKPKWSDEFAPTAPLFGNVPNEMSASYNPYLGKFLALHTYSVENKLVMRTAPEISGPWSEPELVCEFTKPKPDTFFYAGKEHPEFARQGGKVIYVTYINSAVYMPTLLEITLI